MCVKCFKGQTLTAIEEFLFYVHNIHACDKIITQPNILNEEEQCHLDALYHVCTSVH